MGYRIDLYLYDMRDGLEEFHKFGVSVVGHTTLSAEVVVVSRDELGEGHTTLRRVFQEVDHFPAELR